MATRTRNLLLAVAVVAVTLALFARTASFEFLNYDDDVYVTANPHVLAGLTADGLRWALGAGYASNWHPLTWLTHMLDVELFGLDAGAHHLTNAVLHALNGALLFLALARLTRRALPSLLVALLFALHPLRAESVAWVAERKDVLAGTLWMATLLAYAGYARGPNRARYLGVSVLLVLGLLAKPMVVTLPAVLLLLDVWPLRRWPTAGVRQLLLEKLPWFALAAASALLTFLVQREGGAVNPLFALGPLERFSNAVVSYVAYVGGTVAPSGLSAFYPHPALVDPTGHSPWNRAFLASLVVLAVLSLFAWRARRRTPELAFGWLWYLGTALPVIGLVQVGLQARADRYTYVPTIGLLIAVIYPACELARRRPRLARPLAAVAALACVACFLASWRQIGTWRDSESVFRRALAVTERNFLAHSNLGETLHQAGRREEAAQHYRAALAIRPNLFPVRTNLGWLLRQERRFEDSARELEAALVYDADYVPALTQLGFTLSALGRHAQAIEVLGRAVELGPDELGARNQLAWLLATSHVEGLRDPEAAYEQARFACERTGHSLPPYLESLAAALAALGRFDEAVRYQTEAVERTPPAQRRAVQQRLELYRSRRPFFQKR